MALLLAFFCLMLSATYGVADDVTVGVTVQPVDLLTASDDGLLWSTNGSGRTVEVTAALPAGCLNLTLLPREIDGRYATPITVRQPTLSADSGATLLAQLSPGGGGCHLDLVVTPDASLQPSPDAEIALTFTLRSPTGEELASSVYLARVVDCMRE